MCRRRTNQLYGTELRFTLQLKRMISVVCNQNAFPVNNLFSKRTRPYVTDARPRGTANSAKRQ